MDEQPAIIIPVSFGIHHCIPDRNILLDHRHNSEEGEAKYINLICEKPTPLSIQFYP